MRWKYAVTLGLLGGILAGLLLWEQGSAPPEAAALLRLEPSPRPVETAADARTDLGEVRKSEAIVLRSPGIIRAAVERPEVKQLAGLHTPEELTGWLLESLRVKEGSNPSLLEVQLTGASPRHVDVVLQAVVAAYLEQVAARPRRQERTAFHTKAPRPETPPAPVVVVPEAPRQVDPPARAPAPRLGEARVELARVEQEREALERQLRLPPASAAIPGTAPETEQALARLVQEDAQCRKLLEDIARETAALDHYEKILVKGLGDPSLRPLLARKEALEKQLSERKEALRRTLPAVSAAPEQARTQQEVSRKDLLEQELKLRAEIQQLERAEAARQGAVKQTRQPPPPPTVIPHEPVPPPVASAGQADPTDTRPELTVSSLGQAVARPPGASGYRLLWSCLGGGGVFLVLAGGVGLIEACRRKVNTPRDIYRELELPVLGVVPSVSPAQLTALATRSDSPDRDVAHVREAVDVLRTVLLRRLGEGPRIILVSSALEGEGKTTLAGQLAQSLARAWRKTLLVDGDLRKPELHQQYHCPLEPGLCEVLRGEMEVSDIIQSTPISRLWLAPAGHWDTHAVQALAQERAAFLFDQLRKQYDYVVVDGGPLLPVADALLTGQHADGVVLAAWAGLSTMPNLHAAEERLVSLQVPILGCALMGGQDAVRRRAGA